MTKSLRVAAKAAENSVARLRAAAVEASQPQPAYDQSSAVGQHQPATSVAGSHGYISCDDVDPELVVDYSVESDDASDSKANAPPSGSPRGAAFTSVPSDRDTDSLWRQKRREMFESSDESDDSSSEPGNLNSAGDKAGDVGTSIDITTCGVGASVDTTTCGVGTSV